MSHFNPHSHPYIISITTLRPPNLAYNLSTPFIPPADDGDSAEWTTRLAENESGRFESRFSAVRVPASTRSPLLAGLRSARLGVWSAHGQGRFALSGGQSQLERLRSDGLVALEYVDDAGEVTERYPHNPNGKTPRPVIGDHGS